MPRIIALIVAAAIALVLMLAARKPDTFNVSRSITIDVPPQRIFPLLDDFHAWRQWSPYEQLDPAMQRSYSGPARGKGAGYAWSSKGKAGQGSMTIIESAPDAHLAIRLAFLRPFRATNTAEFTLRPVGKATEVSWSMHGPSPFVSKLMQVFFDMDHMIGKDFEHGLAQLKQEAEHSATPAPAPLAAAE